MRMNKNSTCVGDKSVICVREKNATLAGGEKKCTREICNMRWEEKRYMCRRRNFISVGHKMLCVEEINVCVGVDKSCMRRGENVIRVGEKNIASVVQKKNYTTVERRAEKC